MMMISKLTVRPSANNVVTTWAISFFSHRSTVWKTSTSSTPYSFSAFWNLQHVYCSHRIIYNTNVSPATTHKLMFSIILNCPPVLLIFGTDPGESLFITWHRTWPSLSTSSKVSPEGNFLPRIDSIHSCASFSCSGLRFDAICAKWCAILEF